MTKIIIISILLLSATAFPGEIYTWTDENGVKRFSNTPVSSQVDQKEVKSVGKETNYVAPIQNKQPLNPSAYDESKLTRSERYMLFGVDNPPQYMSIDKKTNKTVKESAPYKFSWSTPRMNGNELSLSGSVEYGESCKLLTVTAWLFDEYSNRTVIKCQAADVGGSGSRILSGKTSIPSRWGSNWKVESTDASCSQ
jgi:hypothetical protein